MAHLLLWVTHCEVYLYNNWSSVSCLPILLNSDFTPPHTEEIIVILMLRSVLFPALFSTVHAASFLAFDASAWLFCYTDACSGVPCLLLERLIVNWSSLEILGSDKEGFWTMLTSFAAFPYNCSRFAASVYLWSNVCPIFCTLNTDMNDLHLITASELQNTLEVYKSLQPTIMVVVIIIVKTHPTVYPISQPAGVQSLRMTFLHRILLIAAFR